MGYYTIDHNGATTVKDGKKEKHISFKRNQPIEGVKKGDLDHVKGAEYHAGKAEEHESEEDEKK